MLIPRKFYVVHYPLRIQSIRELALLEEILDRSECTKTDERSRDWGPCGEVIKLNSLKRSFCEVMRRDWETRTLRKRFEGQADYRRA
jgi:hypothetical protein